MAIIEKAFHKGYTPCSIVGTKEPFRLVPIVLVRRALSILSRSGVRVECKHAVTIKIEPEALLMCLDAFSERYLETALKDIERYEDKEWREGFLIYEFLDGNVGELYRGRDDDLRDLIKLTFRFLPEAGFVPLYVRPLGVL